MITLNARWLVVGLLWLTFAIGGSFMRAGLIRTTAFARRRC